MNLAAIPPRPILWRLLGFFILAVFLVLAYGALRYHTFVGPSVHDDGLFLYAGQACAVGEVPYRDYWDHKPPALFFYLSIPLRLFPFSLFAVKGFSVLWLAVTAIMLFVLLRRFAGWIGAGAALLGFVFFTSAFYTIRSGGMTQEPALIFIVIAIALLIRKGGLSISQILLAGVAFGVAIQFRQTFALTASFGFIWLAMQAWGQPQAGRRLSFHWLLLIAGMIIPEVIISSYFLYHGAWFDLFEASYLFNFAYMEGRPDDVTWAAFWSIHREALFSSGPILILPFFTLILIPWLTPEQRKLALPMWVAFLGDWVAVCLSGEYYSHYYAQAGVSAAVLTALAVDSATRGVKQTYQSFSWRNAVVVPLALALVLVAVWTANEGWSRFRGDLRQILAQRNTTNSEYSFQHSVANVVSGLTAPEDRILLIGRDPNSVYFRAGRYAGSRFYHYSPLWKEKTLSAQTQRQRDAFFNDLREKQPTLLLFDLTRLDPNDELVRIRRFVPESLSYIQENYVSLEEIVGDIPFREWFWYEIRLIFWVRVDQVDAVRERFEVLTANL